jgi:hypothetical protein
VCRPQITTLGCVTRRCRRPRRLLWLGLGSHRLLRRGTGGRRGAGKHLCANRLTTLRTRNDASALSGTLFTHAVSLRRRSLARCRLRLGRSARLGRRLFRRPLRCLFGSTASLRRRTFWGTIRCTRGPSRLSRLTGGAGALPGPPALDTRRLPINNRCRFTRFYGCAKPLLVRALKLRHVVTDPDLQIVALLK